MEELLEAVFSVWSMLRIYITRTSCHDQYSFKRGHFTAHALLRNIERITHGFNSSKATVTLFLDIV
jgi:hypothetical protein